MYTLYTELVDVARDVDEHPEFAVNEGKLLVGEIRFVTLLRSLGPATLVLAGVAAMAFAIRRMQATFPQPPERKDADDGIPTCAVADLQARYARGELSDQDLEQGLAYAQLVDGDFR
jgi:hypothetical protein